VSDMQEFNQLLCEADAFNSQINATLNVVVAANGGKEPFHSQLLACHAANDACGKKHAALAQWGKTHEATFHAEQPPYVPPTNPSGPSPVDPVPNDSVLRNFGPMFQATTYTTHAGGDGRFSFSTASGNAYHKMWVNGVLVIDGGMTPIAVKAGDKIDMQITTQTQNNATYSLNK
jgi:hypothetical protein